MVHPTTPTSTDKEKTESKGDETFFDFGVSVRSCTRGAIFGGRKQLPKWPHRYPQPPRPDHGILAQGRSRRRALTLVSSFCFKFELADRRNVYVS